MKLKYKFTLTTNCLNGISECAVRNHVKYVRKGLSTSAEWNFCVMMNIFLFLSHSLVPQLYLLNIFGWKLKCWERHQKMIRCQSDGDDDDFDDEWESVLGTYIRTHVRVFY